MKEATSSLPFYHMDQRNGSWYLADKLFGLCLEGRFYVSIKQFHKILFIALYVLEERSPLRRWCWWCYHGRIVQDCPFKILFHNLSMVFDLVEQITSLRTLDEDQGRPLPVVHARWFFLYTPKSAKVISLGRFFLQKWQLWHDGRRYRFCRKPRK